MGSCLNSPTDFVIREVRASDRSWIEQLTRNFWGEERVVVHEEVFRPADLPGLIALDKDKKPIGLLTYQVREKTCELVTLNSLQEGIGLGSALLEALKELALNSGCRIIALTTTNENQQAIDFYQRRGFRIAARRQGAVDRARVIKPSIPEYSRDGIPIRDELDLVLVLGK
jgi:ribosomal protein S18 acetylase RimI-like enzyme